MIVKVLGRWTLAKEKRLVLEYFIQFHFIMICSIFLVFCRFSGFELMQHFSLFSLFFILQNES